MLRIGCWQLAAQLSGSKEDELSQQVTELRQLANADIKLLIERSQEDRRENNCEMSRLRCELRETIAQAQTNELDVNEKLAIQRNKLQVLKQHYTMLHRTGLDCIMRHIVLYFILFCECVNQACVLVHKHVRDSVCA